MGQLDSLDPAELQDLLEKLRQLRSAYERRFSFLKSSVGPHDESVAALALELGRIAAAMARLAAGTYGTCTACECAMRFADLKERPERTMCPSCEADE